MKSSAPYDEEMPCQLESSDQGSAPTEEQMEVEGEPLDPNSTASRMSTISDISQALEDPKESKHAAGLQFFSASKKEEEEERSRSDEELGLVDQIQPMPHNAAIDSQPGAYATRGTAPFRSLRNASHEERSSAPATNVASPDIGEEQQGHHLVEASLVELPPEIPVAEIVQAPEEGTSMLELNDEEPKAFPSNSPKRKYLFLGSAAVLLLAVAGLAIGVACGTGHCSSTTDLTQENFEEDARPPLVLASGSNADGLVSVILAGTSSINLPNYTIEALEDRSSPQSKAFQWLSTELERTPLLAMEEWRKVQLFVLAVVYYSVVNPQYDPQLDYQQNWLNTTAPECTWTTTVPGTLGSIHLKCTKYGFVRAIDMFDFRKKPVLPLELELLPNLRVLQIENSGI